MLEVEYMVMWGSMFPWVEPSRPHPLPQWALQTFSPQWREALTVFPGVSSLENSLHLSGVGSLNLRYQQESWELLTLGCLGLSPKHPMWVHWATVATSGWLGRFAWEPGLHQSTVWVPTPPASIFNNTFPLSSHAPRLKENNQSLPH